MKSPSSFFVAAALISLAIPSLAHADPEPDAIAEPVVEDPCAAHSCRRLHDGFYARLGANLLGGYTTFTTRGASGRTHGTELGQEGMLLLGGTPWPGLTLGGGFRSLTAHGEFGGGGYDKDAFSGFDYTIGPFVDWYPRPAKGWHVGALAGLGVAWMERTRSGHTSTLYAFGAPGATVFAGHDWWVGNQFSIGLQLTASASASSAIRDTDGNDTGYRIAPRSVGIELTAVVH
jgi:hypothetical protein